MPDGRNTYAKQVVHLRTGREVPDLLRELYLDKRHTQREIAAALGVSRMAVAAWLKEYGITRDDRPAVAL